MYVRDILADKGTEVVTVTPETTMRELSRRLVEKRIGAVVVVGADGSVAGVISERDIVEGVAESGANCLDQQVRTLMTSKVITCTPETRIDEIMSQMTERHIRHLPVLDNGRLAGIVSIGDVVKHRIAEAQREAELLREYINA